MLQCNDVRWKKGQIPCPTPEMDNVGKCPTIAQEQGAGGWGVVGSIGHSWN